MILGHYSVVKRTDTKRHEGRGKWRNCQSVSFAATPVLRWPCSGFWTESFPGNIQFSFERIWRFYLLTTIVTTPTWRDVSWIEDRSIDRSCMRNDTYYYYIWLGYYDSGMTKKLADNISILDIHDTIRLHSVFQWCSSTHVHTQLNENDLCNFASFSNQRTLENW